MSGQITELLDQLGQRGLSVTVAGADLRLQGPKDRIDADLVGRIRTLKPELVEFLQAQQDEAERAFDVTLLQRSYLIGRGDAVELGNTASHVYHELAGHWDVERLEVALNQVISRHGMLRTRFTEDGRQLELETVPYQRIARYDLSDLDRDEQQRRLLELRESRSHRRFSIDQAPLLAAEVSVLSDQEMRLHVGHDGLIMDGISMFLFFRQWHAAYTGSPAPAASEAGFADYIAALAKAQTRAPYERSRSYWLDRLAELAPHPDLPLAAAPASISQARFRQHTVGLEAPEWTAVKSAATAHGLTPTGVLLAAYAETLSRWGAGDRFTLNSTLANRPPIHPRMSEAIGNFSETILIEVSLDSGVAFTEQARGLQARLRRDLDHRHFSGIEVLRELARREGPARAAMPFTFNSTIGYLDASLDGSAVELFGPEVATSSQTPGLWLNAFAFELNGAVVVQLDEVDGLFPTGLIAAIADGYRRRLSSLATEAGWTSGASELPPSQLAVRAAANDTAVELTTAALEADFLDRVRETPGAAAIITSGRTMTYAELHQRAQSAAAWLRSHQVGRDELVGLVMHRGPEQLVAIMATILAGAAYLPIDARLPVERQRYLLADGGVRCVLTNDALTNDVLTNDVLTNDVVANEVVANEAVANEAVANDGSELAVLRLDADEPAPAAVALDPRPDSSLDDLAYVLYTSGTTGEPKGVMVSRRSVANVVADCRRRFGITSRDRFFGISAFNFDLSVWDVFGALSAGAAVVLPDAERATDPEHWLALCQQAGVTIWNSVPAIVALLQEQAAHSGGAALASLRLVMMSGDRIPPTLPAALRALVPTVEVCSLGGPTETTIWNIQYPIDASYVGQTIPYGRPNDNNRAYILDAHDRDAPDWITGEICAAGTGLARGYWRDQARTEARFFIDPSRQERLFRTGDLGRYRPDGTIEILGRNDFQIKVNGYRIEAGEVETRLVAIPAVKQAAVVRQAAARGDRLVAHLVATGTARPSDDELRAALRQHLPEYMLPSMIQWHQALPLTRNGKLDREVLGRQALAESSRRPDGQQRPSTDLQLRLAELWAGVLRCEVSDLQLDTNFYAAAGDSLAAARVLTGLRKQFGVGITLDRFFQVDTLRAMAEHLEAAIAAKTAENELAR